MRATEIYRYFWIKVSDEEARIASAKAMLELQHTLLRRSMEVAPGTPEAEFWRIQRAMARRYLGGETMNAVTKIVIVAPHETEPTLDVLSTQHSEGVSASMEVSIAAMPRDYRRETSLDWIKTPVGRAWAMGAAVCRLSYAVIAPASVASRSTPYLSPV